MVDLDYLQSHLGPVQFIAVEIPQAADASAGLGQIVELVNQHVIRVLDFEFVGRRGDGTLGPISPAEIGWQSGFDFTTFEGSYSGLLSQDDLEEVASTLQQGSIVAILVYEEIALLPALAAFEANGSSVLATGSIDLDELAALAD